MGYRLSCSAEEHNRGEGAIDVAIDPESAGADRPFAWLKALLAQGTKADRACACSLGIFSRETTLPSCFASWRPTRPQDRAPAPHLTDPGRTFPVSRRRTKLRERRRCSGPAVALPGRSPSPASSAERLIRKPFDSGSTASRFPESSGSRRSHYAKTGQARKPVIPER